MVAARTLDFAVASLLQFLSRVIMEYHEMSESDSISGQVWEHVPLRHFVASTLRRH